MKHWKRVLTLIVTLCLLAACSPARSKNTPSPAVTPENTVSAPAPAADRTRVSMLKGPTGLGAARLMDLDQERTSRYECTVFAEPGEAVAALSKGEMDIAALPTNLAAALYHKLDGGVRLLALNTLGVLYILENGDSVHSMADLRGKTIHAFGQGANPEFILNCLLEQNGLDPGEDVTLQWYPAADEVASAMASGQIDLCMLPVPAATAVQLQNPQVRSAVSLNEAWDEAGMEGVMTMGCVVVRTEFAEERPALVDQFLEEYRQSVAFMSDSANLDEAAQLAETYGVVPKAAIAKKALPDANLCLITGDDMIDGIQGYYQVLFRADPASIGGSIPDGAFYYISN